MSEATDEAKQEAIDMLNEYYDLLIDNTANEIFKENLMETFELISSGFGDLMGILGQLFSALTNRRIADLDAWLQAELEAAGLVEETTVERLQNELDAAIEAGDTETIERLRDDLERARIEEEYQKKLALIKYKGELAAYKFKLASAIASAPIAVINAIRTGYGAGFPAGIFLGPALGILAGSLTAIQIAALKLGKPQPPSAAGGGIVLPTAGGTDVNVAENEGAELLLNSGGSGEAFLNEFAQRIADIINPAAGGKVLQIHLYMDGKLVAESSANYYNNGIVRVDI